MKNLFLLLLISFYHVSAVAQNPFAGDWEGKIGAIRLILHITENDGKLSATLDSPDQGAKGLKCDEVITNKDSITVTLNMANASYNGVLTSDKNTLAGTWKQGGQSVALDLKKGNVAAIESIKPQTPKPPFPYQSEEVEYDNSDKSVHFGATFTKPNGKGPFPTVIIISGSGAQDRDGSMMGHKPYAVLADHLTRNGIAVLRADDRGIGKTSLGTDFKKLTSVDFANDVEAGINYLQSRTDIKSIGLVGHSEGGMIAPMVAAKNKKVAFIVLLAGSGQKGEDIWKYQMRNMFVRKGLTKNDTEKANALVNNIMDAFKNSNDLNTIHKQMRETYADWKKGVDDSTEKRILNSYGVAPYLELATSLSSGLSWLQFFMKHDPATDLEKIKIPVLAINGEEDIQVLAKENLGAIKKALKDGGNKKYTIKSFPQLNHLFQTTSNKEQPYSSIEETFSPIALNYVTQWILQQVK